MEYRQLGRSGSARLKLTLGTMTFGGVGKFRDVGHTDLEGARRQIDMALEAGVNLIDTAERLFRRGRSEEIVGRGARGATRRRPDRHQGALPDGRRAQRRWPLTPPPDPGMRGEPAPAAHRPHRPLPGPRMGRPDAARGDARRARAPRAERQGPLRRLLELRRLAGHEGARDRRRATGCRAFVSQQVYLSLQERSAEYEIVPSAIDQGLGLLIWSPLAGGLLSGKYRRGEPAPEGSRHASEWRRAAGLRRGQALRHRRGARRVADGHGVSPAQVALAWLLGRPGVTTRDRRRPHRRAARRQPRRGELELSDEERARLEEISRPPLLYPFWHQRNTAADRLSVADLSLIAPQLDGSLVAAS